LATYGLKNQQGIQYYKTISLAQDKSYFYLILIKKTLNNILVNNEDN